MIWINPDRPPRAYLAFMRALPTKKPRHASGDRRLWLYVLFPLFGHALVIFGLFGAYMIAAPPGAPRVQGLELTLKYLVSPWMLAAEATALAFLVFGYVFVKTSPWSAGDAQTVESVIARQRLRLILAQALFALALTATGSFYAIDLLRETQRETRTQAQTLAQMKAGQIDNWLYRRSIEAELAAASLQEFPLERWSSDPEVAKIAGVLMSEFLAGRRERVSFTLLTPDGTVLASRGSPPAPDTLSRVLEATSQAGVLQIVASGPTLTSPETSTLTFGVPLRKPGNSAPAAILALAVDPAIDLFSQVQQWPMSETSGQIVVVRRLDNDLLLVVPTGTANAPSKALREAIVKPDGAHEGRDYRGVEVVAASARVRGIADWCVVAKLDRDPIMAGVHRRIRTMVLVVIGMILLAAAIGSLLWRGQRAGVLSLREHQQAELSAVIRHYEGMAASVRDPAFLTDARGYFLEANAAAIAQYGYSLQELRTMRAIDLRATGHRDSFEHQWSSSTQAPGRVYETVHRRKNGTTFPVEVSNNAFEIDGKVYTQAFVRDLSERRALELQVARLSRVQEALFNAGSALLRARSKDQLFQDMCRILVQDGGYRLATVGMASQDEARTVRFVATAGVAREYLDEIRVSWGEGPLGAGPTGSAIREGVLHVNQDYTRDARLAPWREAALKWDIQASIGLPLRCGGKVIGALTIFAEQPNAFDVEEVALLTRFAENISYGLDKLQLKS